MYLGFGLEVLGDLLNVGEASPVVFGSVILTAIPGDLTGVIMLFLPTGVVLGLVLGLVFGLSLDDAFGVEFGDETVGLFSLLRDLVSGGVVII